MTEAQPIQPYSPVKPLVTPEQAAEEWRAFEELKRRILKKDDYQPIGGKFFPKRSAFRKIAVYFGISDRIIEQERVDRDDGSFMWRIVVEARAPNGRVSTGVGICDSRERNFAHVEHDVYATAHTRAKNRAISDMVAGGVVSAEELDAETPTPEQAPVQTPPNANDGYTQPRKQVQSEQAAAYIVDREAVLNAVERAGLDPTPLNVYWDGGVLVVEPSKYLGDVWMAYMDALRPLGAEWVRMGKQSRWEIKPGEAQP